MVNMENDRQPPTPTATANPEAQEPSFDPSEPGRKEEEEDLAENQQILTQNHFNFSSFIHTSPEPRRKPKTQDKAAATGRIGGGRSPSTDKQEKEKRKRNPLLGNLAVDNIKPSYIRYPYLSKRHQNNHGALPLTGRTPRRKELSKITKSKGLRPPKPISSSSKQHKTNQHENNNTKQGPETHDRDSEIMIDSQDSEPHSYKNEQNQTNKMQRSFDRFSSKKCFLQPDCHSKRVVSDTPKGSETYFAKPNINTENFANDQFGEEPFNQCTEDLKTPPVVHNQLAILHSTKESPGRELINGLGCLPLAAQMMRMYFHGPQALKFGGYSFCRIWFPHDPSANSAVPDLCFSFSKPNWIEAISQPNVWDARWLHISTGRTNHNMPLEEIPLVLSTKCALWREWMVHRNYSSATQTPAPSSECPQNYSQLVGGWFTFGGFLSKKSSLDPGDNVERVVMDVPAGSGNSVLRFSIKMKFSANDQPEEKLINHFANNTKIALTGNSQIAILHVSTDNADQAPVTGRDNLPPAAQPMQVNFHWARALGEIWLACNKPASSVKHSKSSSRIWIQNVHHKRNWDAGYFICSALATDCNALTEKIPLMSGVQRSLRWRGVMSENLSLDNKSSATSLRCPEKYSEIADKWLDKASSITNLQPSVHLPLGMFLEYTTRIARVLAPAPCLSSAAFCGTFGFQDAVPDNCIMLHWKQVQHGYRLWSQPNQSDRRWIERLIEKHWQVSWDHWSQWEQRGAA